jgi:hypothetical protein
MKKQLAVGRGAEDLLVFNAVNSCNIVYLTLLES